MVEQDEPTVVEVDGKYYAPATPSSKSWIKCMVQQVTRKLGKVWVEV